MSDGKPQTSEGFIRIANELHEAIARFNFTGRERRVIDAIIAKTYGFHKVRDHISQSQIAEYTNIDQANISRILSGLVKKNAILSTGSAYKRVLEVNKMYKLWSIKIHVDVDMVKQVNRLTKTFKSQKSDMSTSTSKSMSTSTSKSMSTSTYTKDTRHKTVKHLKHLLKFEKRKSARFFEIFWNYYPRKVGKKAAITKWLKINPNKKTARLIISKVRETNQKKWSLSESKFIPHAATWLNGERWLDEIDDERTQTGIQTNRGTTREQSRRRLDEIAKADIEQNWTTASDGR